MIIPLHVDEVKDKDLIEYLKQQTNRSAFIRFVLNEYRMRNGNGVVKVNESSNTDQKALSSFMGLLKK